MQAEIEGLTGIYSKPDVDEIVLCFRCKPLGLAPNCSDEADEVRYFAPNELPRNTIPKQVERIQDAFVAGIPILKVQRGPSAIDLLKQGRL